MIVFYTIKTIGSHLNLLSKPQNLADSLSEFANDDPPDIGEVNCTSDITELIRKSPGLAWS